MIKIVNENGLDCPKYFCDVCGKVINENGMYVWHGLANKNEVFFVHKGVCDRKFDKHRNICWGELNALSLYLKNNYKSNF